MNSGYINEGGQLKSKNGQKYVINHRKPGVFVPRYCVLLTAVLGIIAMAVIAVLTIFLVMAHSSGDVTTAALLSAPASNDDVAVMRNASSDANPTTTTRPIDVPPEPQISVVVIEEEKGEGANDDDADDDDVFVAVPTSTMIAEMGQEVVVGSEQFVLAEGWSPELYKLVIEPDLRANLSYGDVDIEILSDGPMNEEAIQNPVVLNLNNITILEAGVFVKGSGRVLPTENLYGPRNETYVILIKPEALPFDPSDSLVVRVKFVSRLSDTLTGFYKTTYKTLKGETMDMASTQFSPVDARRAFPCFDRPDKKAQFEISIVRHKNYSMALSNMPSIKTSFPRPDYIRDDFSITPRMSTYLVAFVVSNLVPSNVSRPFENPALPDITMWTRPDVNDQTQFIYTMTTKMLTFLEHYFDIKFGLPKIDMVAVPDFGFSAMENYGLITFRESKFVMAENEEERSVTQSQSASSTLAHELAHQWFGNLVTMKWWNDLWLKEGFATYLSYVTLDSVEPSWQMMDFFSRHEMQLAMEDDSDESAHAISFPVNTTSDIRRIFDNISYKKGACMASMLSGILGDRTFRAGLKSYLKRYQFSNAVQDDLWAIMTEQGHLHQALPEHYDIKTIMDTWTLQAGFPVVTVTRSPLNSDITITQERYTLPSLNATTDSTLWFIPINFETQAHRTQDPMPTHWMPNVKSVTIKDAADPKHWMYVNIRRIGYYRVNYDYQSWIKLSKNFYDLPEITQGQLLDDSLSLARAQKCSYDIPLTLLTKLFQHDKYDAVPWAAATPGVTYLMNMLSREPANEHFQKYMKYIMKPIFDHIGFQESSDDTHVQKMHRVNVIQHACLFGVDRCLNRAKMLYGDWMLKPETFPLSPNLKPAIFCTAIRLGTEVEWQFAYERFLKTPVAAEQETILSALGCTNKPWLLSKYLTMIVSPTSGIRKQDGARAFAAVAQNPVGNELAFDFLSSHIQEIYEYFGEGFSVLSKMIDATTVFANKNLQLTKYELFANEAHRLNLTSVESSIRLLIPYVRHNVHWRDTSYNELEKFLKSLITHLKL